MADPNIIDMRKGIYRRIYAGFLGGKRINSVSIEAECLFWRLHALADDLGNFPADADALTGQAFPRRKVRVPDVNGWLIELRDAKLITLYQTDGESFGSVVGWEENQPAGRNGRRFQRFPTPVGNPGESGGIRGNPGESCKSSTLHSEVHSKDHSEVHSKEHTKGAADAAGFVRFWQAWPSTDRKMGKAKALASWRRQGCEAIADRIVEHVIACAASAGWQNGYDPLPTTYLNRQQWEAPPPPKERKIEAPSKSGIAAALARWESEQ